MPRLLTKTMLRNTAARLWDGTPGGRRASPDSEEFMCFALNWEASGNCHEDDTPEARAFDKLLREHDVGAGGYLYHQGQQYAPEGARGAVAQALRFDFLNLLAESL